MTPQIKARLVVATICVITEYVCFTYFGAPRFVATGAYVLGQIAGGLQQVYLEHTEYVKAKNNRAD